jgi:uncharacterized C2H2 Zn-finger protein
MQFAVMEDLLIDVSNECFLCGFSMEQTQISITCCLQDESESISCLIGEFSVSLFMVFYLIFVISENLTGVTLSPETLISAFICKDCFQKLEEYKSLIMQAEEIKTLLVQMFQSKAMTENQSVWESSEMELREEEEPSDEKTVMSLIFSQESSNITTSIRKGPRKFSCEFCGKSLTSAAKLRDHITVHTGERNFKCPLDGLMFKTQDNLNQHLHTHAVTKFECDHCGKLLKTKQTLHRHMTEHKTEKFECKQ